MKQTTNLDPDHFEPLISTPSEWRAADFIGILKAVRTDRELLDELEHTAVIMLRSLGTPWPLIADTLGLSKSTLIRRHQSDLDSDDPC